MRRTRLSSTTPHHLPLPIHQNINREPHAAQGFTESIVFISQTKADQLHEHCNTKKWLASLQMSNSTLSLRPSCTSAFELCGTRLQSTSRMRSERGQRNGILSLPRRWFPKILQLLFWCQTWEEYHFKITILKRSSSFDCNSSILTVCHKHPNWSDTILRLQHFPLCTPEVTHSHTTLLIIWKNSHLEWEDTEEKGQINKIRKQTTTQWDTWQLPRAVWEPRGIEYLCKWVRKNWIDWHRLMRGVGVFSSDLRHAGDWCVERWNQRRTWESVCDRHFYIVCNRVSCVSLYEWNITFP